MLDDLRCTGLEYRLIECVHRGLGVHSCSHSEDVGVRCIAGEKLYQTKICKYLTFYPSLLLCHHSSYYSY